MPTPLSQVFVKRIFNYDPETGKLTWKTPPMYQKAEIGDEVGSIQSSGRYVKIQYELYRVAPIIWLWVYGYWPKGFPDEVIDHKDRNPLNNRLDNLKLTTIAGNNKNKGMYKSNTSGFTGVSFSKKVYMYAARLKINKREIWLGYFKTAEEAAEARRQAEIKYRDSL